MVIDSALGGMQSPVLRSTRLRLSTFLVAFALVAASLFLVQHKAEAAPVPNVAVATVASGSAVVAQFSGFDFRSIVCPILIAVRNAFARSPFFAFVQPILNQLLVAFGCAPSG